MPRQCICVLEKLKLIIEGRKILILEPIESTSQLELPIAPDQADDNNSQNTSLPQQQQQQYNHNEISIEATPSQSTLDSSHDQPSRKRQRQNLQDVSNKSITPSRASGRIRIKMEAAAAAAEQQKQQQQQQETSEKQQPVAVTATQSQKPQVSMKHRKRRTKNKQINGDSYHELQIDVKRPNSVLVDTSIRALLTSFAFSRLSPENQKILIESLPLVDRPSANDNEPLALNPSSINNEFFNRACIEWRDRLAYGEFTNEHQTKLRAEQEREKSKIDPWKARNFEGIWGIKSNQKENLGEILEKSALEVKQLEQGDFEIPAVYINEVWKNEKEEEVETRKEVEEEEIVDEIVEEQEEVIEEEEEEEDEEEEAAEEAEPEEEEEEEEYKIMMPSPSQNPSVSTSVPTPPETVTSTQPDMNDSPNRKSPSPQPAQIQATKSPSPPLHTPIIAEATSSADDVTPILPMDSPEPSTSNFIADDDDDIASHVELSSDGMPTTWYHQQEHDYLKNMPDMEQPESSGMEEMVGDIVDDTAGIELIENDNAIDFQTQSTPQIITNYDAELTQEIFHKNEPQNITTSTASTNFSQNSSVLINNYVKQEEQQQQQSMMFVENQPRFNQVVVKDEQNDGNYQDTYMMEETEIDSGNAFQDEIHVNMPKNVKLLAFPSGVNYINNDKYIIEEQPQPQHIPQQSTSTFRTNGTNIQPIQNSYFVGGANTFTYISKMGNKIEPTEPTTRIVKQESNNNQSGAVKQRIIYEISTEPKVSYEQPTHHVTYAAPPQPEIYHKMVNHNGTTTIYTESTGPPQKKTIIQRKKPNDPYTVQVALQSVANNNTIILTPIGNATTQQVTQQPQKSIVHIHRAAPIMQTASPPMQFLTAAPSQTFIKKQTVIIPQMAPVKTTPKYTTVIRAPAPQMIQTQPTPPQPQPVQMQSVAKIQKPIQKQKVIMSTSSLQQYRSFNQKPNVHGSRKQLHPQHIIRPAPAAATTTTVIHHPIGGEQKTNQIPVQLLQGNATETFTQIPTNQVVSASPTVVTINSAPTKSIFVRRPPQIFQSQHNQQIFTTNQQPAPQTIVQTSQNQIMTQPRMRSINPHRPPGSVNLERSYQICQAVIQNSPNRHQLNCQLKPPPSTLLGSSNGNLGQKKF
ncbi:hypothetical protein PVAND_015799 [Polypedilum vanderplanki]|uniref:DEUBAD domain-containing protein n=1 Tax=Polypedilum vanderplanki TaxID=319348 RepID=A0A9J6BE69_POLVA|nr:hypothetical protein PVAND_015799 [Polypedilum vanderplanki]